MPKSKGARGGHVAKFGDKKRSFHGNRHTAECDTALTGASCSKIKDKNFTISADVTHQYVFISFACVFGALSRSLKCKTCNGNVRFEKTNNQGLGFQLCVICNCSNNEKIDSCPTALNSFKNHKIFDINRRIVFGMRLLGVGLTGLTTFCGIMDLSCTFSQTLYDGIMANMAIACKAVFDKSIQAAVDEENEKTVENGKPERILTVSGDGTWARRGYSSLLGVVTLIGKYSGKIVDAIVKNSFCLTCAKTKKQLSKGEFESWYEQHKDVCKSNHNGSAGKMEVDGIFEMFQRSPELHDVYYGEYIGDGDSKTFPNLLQKQPYGENFIIHKLECILHVGKRMFKRLRDLKKQLTAAKKVKKEQEKQQQEEQKAKKSGAPPAKRSKKSEPPKVEEEDAKQNLTDKVIREMSTYYALAIQRHENSTDAMKNEIMAGYHHKISTDEFPQHQFCDVQWCKYMQNTAAGVEFQHPPPPSGPKNSASGEADLRLFDQRRPVGAMLGEK